MYQKNELAETLRKIGLSGYEAYAYISLVALGEATAREVSENAGIPRTKVYEVLYGLLDKGFAEIQPGKPAIFKAIEPAKIASRIQLEFNRNLEKMLKSFEMLRTEERREKQYVWVSRGRWAVENRLREFIREARKELMIFCISDEFADVLREVGGEHKVLLYEKIKVPENIRNWRILKTPELKNSGGFLARFAEMLGGIKEDVLTKPEILVISENKSILSLSENGNYIAVSIFIPLIVLLQKEMFTTLFEEYAY